MAELCRVGLAELGPERGGPLYVAREGRQEPVDVTLKAALDDPDHGAWVGTIDDVVIGYLVGRIDDLGDGRRLGVIEDVFVEELARSVGVGEALMDQALQWFQYCSCLGVDAVALPGMRETKNFFETFGFTARMLVVHHRLDAPAPDAP
jgi:GNAT superfamily N-acetyltransferase